ncbi:MAG: carboxypeptidase-like regulatory domain-containing protein [Candidatus Scalindua sp.]
MSYKFFCVSLVLILIICTKVYADTLKLEGFDEKIDVKILEMNEDYIRVIVSQSEIGSISIKSERDSKYPDTVFINVDGKEKKVICKIVKITKTPGNITLQIPRERVSAIQISFPGSNQMDTSSAHREERAQPPVDTEQLKEQIMEQIRREFEIKQEMQEQESVSIEDKIKKELTLEFEEKQQIKEEIFEAENYGRVTGRMFYKGKPLPGCQVKITMLEKWGIFGKPKEGLRFETITDENGRYLFEKVNPGGYKIYWKPPHESSWIRSIKMEPDLFVDAGETYRYRDRETNVKTAN